MRISTQQIYDSSITSIQQQAGDVMKYQAQIASGKKYQNASDSPQAVGYGMKLDFDKAQYDMFAINQKKMFERVDNTDAQLMSINAALAKFKQVVVQSNSAFAEGTLSTTLYQEASSLRDSIKSFAQAKDTSDQPILMNMANPDPDLNPDLEGKLTLGKVSIDLNISVDEGVSLAESMGVYGDGNTPRIVVAGKQDILSLLDIIVTKLQAGTKPSDADSTNLDISIGQIRGSQVKIGIINAQVTNAQDSVELKKVNADNARSAVLDTDIAESSANLGKSQALLQAAQSIFAKIQSSTLFDKI
jgi:flagellar hook-associated protein 3 FlgL